MTLRNLCVCSLMALGWALGLLAAESIAISITPRYPWNGNVDIAFTITGESGVQYDTSFIAKDLAGNTNLMMKTLHKSDGTAANAAKEMLLPGAYNWVWDAEADIGAGVLLQQVQVVATTFFTYSVKFNANGGAGTMSNESFTYGTAKALTANAFTRTGFTFLGWATSANGAKVYSNKQSVSNLTTTASATVNLYAVWAVSGGVQLWANGPYWAECNVGATKPEESGYYFWWGDTVGYKRNASNNGWVSVKNVASFSFNAISIPFAHCVRERD